MKRLIPLGLGLLLACKTPTAGLDPATHLPRVRHPRQVILMIGDGMGIGQIAAARYSEDRPLHMERMPVVGLVRTTCADDLITDSAAGATAMATGKKTFRGAIGVDADTVPQPTLLEMAEASGLATGMVVTCELTNATPAAFIAHQDSRVNNEAIASDYLKTDVDLLMGGGQTFFDLRSDGRNLLAEWRQKGYLIRSSDVFSISELEVPPDSRLVYFTATEAPPRKLKGRDYLPEGTRYALNFLHDHSEKGFFLMVEGSQIDWGGHANSAEYIISEMRDFDEAVGEALAFAEADGHTLV
ncbi:MAG: alkaline phosphatase, partial [Bacteroidetes bacterium]